MLIFQRNILDPSSRPQQATSGHNNGLQATILSLVTAGTVPLSGQVWNHVHRIVHGQVDILAAIVMQGILVVFQTTANTTQLPEAGMLLSYISKVKACSMA